MRLPTRRAASPFSTGSVTGNEVDRRIVAAVEEESQGRVHIDRTTAREYKEEHADVYDFEPFTDVIQQWPGGGATSSPWIAAFGSPWTGTSTRRSTSSPTSSSLSSRTTT